MLPADEVVLAVGSEPNTQWLAGSGLEIGDGVQCDEFSCAAPGVYAAGDVARWYNPLFATSLRIEHRTNATEQGVAVARNLLSPDNLRPYAPVPSFWSTQYGLRLQAHGVLRGHHASAVVEGDLDKDGFIVAYRRDNVLVGVLGAA